MMAERSGSVNAEHIGNVDNRVDENRRRENGLGARQVHQEGYGITGRVFEAWPELG